MKLRVHSRISFSETLSMDQEINGSISSLNSLMDFTESNFHWFYLFISNDFHAFPLNLIPKFSRCFAVPAKNSKSRTALQPPSSFSFFYKLFQNLKSFWIFAALQRVEEGVAYKAASTRVRLVSLQFWLPLSFPLHEILYVMRLMLPLIFGFWDGFVLFFTFDDFEIKISLIEWTFYDPRVAHGVKKAAETSAGILRSHYNFFHCVAWGPKDDIKERFAFCGIFLGSSFLKRKFYKRLRTKDPFSVAHNGTKSINLVNFDRVAVEDNHAISACSPEKKPFKN